MGLRTAWASTLSPICPNVPRRDSVTMSEKNLPLQSSALRMSLQRTHARSSRFGLRQSPVRRCESLANRQSDTPQVRFDSAEVQSWRKRRAGCESQLVERGAGVGKSQRQYREEPVLKWNVYPASAVTAFALPFSCSPVRPAAGLLTFPSQKSCRTITSPKKPCPSTAAYRPRNGTEYKELAAPKLESPTNAIV